MKYLKIYLLVLMLILLAACTSRTDVTTDAPVSRTEDITLESFQDELVQDVISTAPLPPESTPEDDEPVSKLELPKSELTPKEPDTTSNPKEPLSDAKEVGDDQAVLSLDQPLAQLSALDNNSIVWGPGVAKAEVAASEPTGLQAKYGQYDAYFFVPDSSEIYLSFDEGYELGYTPVILDVLKEKDVTAVFFVTTGYVKSRPDLIRRMIDEGHVVGNHSTSHPVGGMPTMPTLGMVKDVLFLHNFVNENFDYNMTLFRPPEGTFSQQSLEVLQSLGYKSIFWSFAYNDWNPDNQKPLDEALSHIVSCTHPGGIFLLHAVSQTNASVLGEAIDQIRAKGYTFSDWDDLA